MFILFDSNVWISQLGLQSENGAAVRYFANRRSATVAIPEVVQLEVAQESEAVEDILMPHEFELCDGVEGDVNCFATEEAETVYFTFSLAHPCRDSTGAGRRDGELKLKGSGFLDPESEQPPPRRRWLQGLSIGN